MLSRKVQIRQRCQRVAGSPTVSNAAGPGQWLKIPDKFVLCSTFMLVAKCSSLTRRENTQYCRNTTILLTRWRTLSSTWFFKSRDVNVTVTTLHKSIGMLFRPRFYLSLKTKLTLYYSLIYPCITYCNSTWSSTYTTNLIGIHCLQNRAVRAITNSDYRAHSAPLFFKLGILDIYQINRFQIAKFRYCCHNKLLPPLFFNLFFYK